jgi:hypothetical protein
MRPTARNSLTIEGFLTILAFGLALYFRMLNIGAFPLSEFEAEWALKAYNLATGNPGATGAQPAYLILTGLLFNIFNDNEATARFFPALAGSCLVFLPWLFASFSGYSPWLRRVGLIFAFGVALDPGLVTVSRLAGGPMMALAFTLLAAGFFIQGRAIRAGVLTGLAVMSGPDMLKGMIVLGLSVLVAILIQNKGLPVMASKDELPVHLFDQSFWRKSGVFAAGTVLLGGLLFLRFPQGLAGLVEMIPAYLAGWINSSGVPAFRLPVSLLLYQPLAAVLGVVAVIRAWQSGSFQGEPDRFLSLWIGCSLILSMLYPSRQVVDTIWVLAPLWLLAASELNHYGLPSASSSFRIPSLTLAGVISFFIFLIWYNLLRLGNLGAQPYLYAAIIGGLILMLLIVFVLFSLGWGFSTARFGVVWGFSLIAGMYGFSAMWGSSQVRPNNPVELWTIAPGIGKPDILIQTLEDLSAWQYGMNNEIEMQTSLSEPGLKWALRNFHRVDYISKIGTDQMPEVILTDRSQNEPALQASYRGQELVWSKTALWHGVLPPNLLRWLTYRELPTSSNIVILWARSDLFPGDLSLDNESPSQPLDSLP